MDKVVDSRAVRVALALALVSCMVPVRRACAFAPAIPAAAAATTALAAEVGISAESLCLALGATVAAGTGLTLAWQDGLFDGTSSTPGYESNWQDKYKTALPGFDDWDAYHDKNIDNPDALDNPKAYKEAQWATWLAAAGLLSEQVGDGGGYEPTPEPDPDDDPDGHAKWQQRRNVIVALAGGGAVLLSQAVGWLADTAAGGIKTLLYGANDGTANTGLGLLFEQDVMVSGRSVKFAVLDCSAGADITYSP